MKLSEFDYYLPPKLIAQEPVSPSDYSRLLVLKRKTGRLYYRRFYQVLEFLNKNDVLVFNDSRVIPARLKTKKSGGKQKEVFLLQPYNASPKNQLWSSQWLVIGKPLPKQGEIFSFGKNLKGKIIGDFRKTPIIEFNLKGKSLAKEINLVGEAPLPPYIKNPTSSSFKKYQTVYAKNPGSVAAPTAGFHFTKQLFQELENKKIQKEFITLHVGLGTFQPVRSEEIENHQMHSEYFSISPKTAKRLNEAKKQGKNIVAIGTTSLRALEFSANKQGRIKRLNGWNNLFIFPGYEFKFVDKLITNFHLPQSTLLMLTCAFAGKGLTFKAYGQAIDKEFRFYSFGDAMYII